MRGARRYCKGPGCLSPIPSDADTHAEILALAGRPASPALELHAFGYCSALCEERHAIADQIVLLKRTRSAPHAGVGRYDPTPRKG